MSSECLTVTQARIKLGFTGATPAISNEFVTKYQCLAMNAKSDLLAKYPTDWECPANDDIVLNEIVPEGKHLSGTMIPQIWYSSTDKRCGYYSGGYGSYTITRNDIGTLSQLGFLMIVQRADLSLAGPHFHAETGRVDNVNRVAITFSFLGGHYLQGVVNHNGPSNWWSFMGFVGQEDWKQKTVDGMIANQDKSITWDMVFWYE